MPPAEFLPVGLQPSYIYDMLVRICTLIACLVVVSRAQYVNAGSAEFVFVRNFESARPAGMVDAGASLEGGLQSLGINPAGTARTDGPWLEVSGREQFQSYQSGMIAYSQPELSGNLTGQLAYLDEGSPITVLDANDNATGQTMKPTAWMVTTTYAEPLGQRLAWGGTIRWVYENLDIPDGGTPANGVDMDLGVILQPGSKRFVYGLSLTNLGTKLTGDTRTESEFGDMPLSANASVRALLSDDGWTSAILDIDKPIDNYIQARIGLEQKIFPCFTVRGGFRTDEREVLDLFDQEVLGDPASTNVPSNALRASLGATIALSDWSIEYAWQAWGPLGYVNFLTFNVHFGRPKPSQETASP
jgi:hypothetical protein